MAKVISSKALSVALRDARKKQRLNQSDVAKLAGGIKQATVSKIENDASQTKIETLFKLASALGLEIHLKERKTPSVGVDEW